MRLTRWVGLGAVFAILPEHLAIGDGGGMASAIVCDMSVGGGSAALDATPMCNMTFSSCADGNTYAVECPGAPESCTCTLNGRVVKSFFETGHVCGVPVHAIPAINEACGWNLSNEAPLGGCR